MADYALSSGLEVPSPVMTALDALNSRASRMERGIDPAPGAAPSFAQLSQIHQSLARIVYPATPRSILLLARERRRPLIFRIFGPVPLIRGLTIAALISVAAWIGLSTTDAADGTVNWTTDHGVRLLIEEFHLLAAAGVGAAFAGLFQASRFVTRGTYDPKYASSYWTRFVLGVVAGMILALLLPIESEALGNMGAPLLAMIGGFSVRVVYRLMNRLVLTVESMIGGDPGAAAAHDIEAERSRMQEEKREERTKLGARLMGILETLQARGSDPATVGRLRELTRDVLGGAGYMSAAPVQEDSPDMSSQSQDTRTEGQESGEGKGGQDD